MDLITIKKLLIFFVKLLNIVKTILIKTKYHISIHMQKIRNILGDKKKIRLEPAEIPFSNLSKHDGGHSTPYSLHKSVSAFHDTFDATRFALCGTSQDVRHDITIHAYSTTNV
jgi:hypothetical protein